MTPWTVADGLELVIAWLSALGETRDDQPTGAVLPFRLVTRTGGPFDGLTDQGVYSVHTFAGTKEDARDEATRTHRRLTHLVGRFCGQQPVVVEGRSVYADDVVTIESPRDAPWTDTIHRYVGTYQVNLRIIAA